MLEGGIKIQQWPDLHSANLSCIEPWEACREARLCQPPELWSIETTQHSSTAVCLSHTHWLQRAEGGSHWTTWLTRGKKGKYRIFAVQNVKEVGYYVWNEWMKGLYPLHISIYRETSYNATILSIFNKITHYDKMWPNDLQK